MIIKLEKNSDKHHIGQMSQNYQLSGKLTNRPSESIHILVRAFRNSLAIGIFNTVIKG